MKKILEIMACIILSPLIIVFGLVVGVGAGVVGIVYFPIELLACFWKANDVKDDKGFLIHDTLN